MRKFTLALFMVLSAVALRAQTAATFDTLGLPRADTFYVNYTSYGNDVGFNDGLAYFSCVYDTSFGYQLWTHGFAYSNKRDSSTAGYMNMYSAKAYTGVDSSDGYAVAWEQENHVRLTGTAVGKPVKGFYVTNSTYTYFAIRDGYFNATAFDSGDWYKLTVRGYHNGQLTADSVDYYLADFRATTAANRYIVKDWRWVDLQPIGAVDSLRFTLSSSDTAGGSGMNTPAYFCMDNFTTFENVGVKSVPAQLAAKVYPNPAINTLYVEVADKAINQARMFDMSGKLVGVYSIDAGHLAINTASLAVGVYTLQLSGGQQVATTRFVKQ